MERLCFTFQLYPGRESEYQKRHDEIWPELVAAIEHAGFRNYSLFRRDRQVVCYTECHPDVASAFARISGSQASARWAEWFSDVVVSLTGADGNLMTLDEVWHLD